jgi:acid stress-induced BolA-like protein IbaG/YrbA
MVDGRGPEGPALLARAAFVALASARAMLYGSAMSSHPTDFQGDVLVALKQAIETAISGSTAEVSGGGGHFSLVVTASVFAGKGMLESQRLVYSAIAHLMKGDMAPVHAIDSLKTKTA